MIAYVRNVNSMRNVNLAVAIGTMSIRVQDIVMILSHKKVRAHEQL